MSDFVRQLRLAEKTAEDIYSSKVDQELIEALHKRMQVEKESCQPCIEAPARYRLVNERMKRSELDDIRNCITPG